MSTPDQALNDKVFLNRAVEAAIRIGLVFALALWCFRIFQPFLTPVIWGIIIAIAVHPLYRGLLNAFGGRRALAATVFTLLALALLITPTMMLGDSLVETVQKLAQGLQDGSLKVPPPPESVATWPLVGKQVNAFWSLASNNLTAAVEQIAPQLEALGKWLLAAGLGTGIGILQFVLSIIIAGVLLANTKASHDIAHAITTRLAGDYGSEFADIAAATVRSVAQGVVGVAIIQALLAGVGLLVMDVPGAGVWALLVLLLAVIQLPTILVLGPIIIYVFSVADTMPAVLFMIWSLFVGFSDTFLKPLFLGRGVDIPMLVVLIGALGGMILSGIIGLFVGAVVLALGYKLFMAWLHQGSEPAAEPAQTEATLATDTGRKQS